MLFGIRWGSLRIKIIAWSFVPTMIILVAVAIVIFYAYGDVTEDLVIERNQELVRLTTSQLLISLKEHANLLNDETRIEDICRNYAPAQRAALKRASSRLSVFDAGVLILDTFGQVVAAEPERPEVLGQNWSDRAYYRQILRSQTTGPAFSDVVADGPDGTDVIVVAVPILGDQGEFVGIMAGMFRVSATTVSTFYGDIVRLRLGKDGNAYLVDGQGKVIYHSNPGRIGDNLSAQEIVQWVTSGEMGGVRTRDLDGREIVASFAPVPDTSWGLVTEEDWATLADAGTGYRRFLLVLLALGVVVPAVVVAVGVTRITRPVTELIDAAQNVAAGNFDQTITAPTGDEIEELAKQFNLMAAQLRESYAHLEQRVANRTKELTTLNAIAATASQSLDLDEILSDVLRKTLNAMDIKAGGIYLLDPHSNLLTIAVHQGFSAQFVAEVDNLEIGEGFSGRVAQSGEPMVVEDVSTDPRLTRTAVQEEGLHSLSIAPLSSKGKVLGTLFAVTRDYRTFTDQDLQLQTSIAHQIGVAVENARLFEAEQRRAEQFQVISEVGYRIASTLAIDELLDQMVEMIQEAFDYYLVEIGLVEKDTVVFKARAGRDWDSPFEGFCLPVDEQSITGSVVTTGQPLLVPDVNQDRRYVRVTDTGTRSELVVPIQAQDKVTGVINVESDHLDAFDKSDVAVLQSLAHQAAVVIENARLFEAEQRRTEQFRVVSEVGRHITSILDVDALLEEIVRLIKETFGYYLITIGLIEGDEVVFKAGAKTHWHKSQFRPPPTKIGGRGITAWVAATGEPLLAPNVDNEPRYLFWPDVSETRSELAVPLKTKAGGIMGVLNVESDQLNAFDESDVQVLQSLANQAAIAIENARLYEQAQRLAAVEERGRLARELHDAVTQTLFSASLIAEVVPKVWQRDPQAGYQQLEEVRMLTRGALAEMRTLLLELRPEALSKSKMGDLLRQLGRAMTGRTGVPVRVTSEGEWPLPPTVQIAMYRIAQEALNNAGKYADASQVDVHFTCESGQAALSISDDGQGFDVDNIPPGHFGVGIMRERTESIGTVLKITSQPGMGTRIMVNWQEQTKE
ncbi:MAG: GAF domain-containing protein [Chloroflexi bacterium]|nr:GAF domain-containing protein [Chloroflexota bacterium]